MPTLPTHFRAVTLFVSTFACTWLIAAPTITQQPGLVTATGGSNASFTVAASGSGTISYQWRRAGAPIAGAIGPTFSIANVGPGDEGAYDVAVTDDSGTPTVSQSGWLVYRSPPGQLWGAGLAAVLGSGDSGGLIAPRRIATGVTRVFAGYGRAFFLKADGVLWAMGSNSAGTQADGTTSSHLLPVQVASDVIDVAAGSGHTLLIKRDHSLWAVGRNTYGQLGNNSTVDSLTPVHIADGVAQVAAGRDHSAYVTQTGELWIWGSGSAGKLGQGNSSNQLQPTFLAAGVKQVSIGPNYSAFIKTDNSLWGMGQWGSSVPAQLATGIRTVTVGFTHVFAIDSSGSLGVMNASGGLFDPIGAGVSAVAADGYENIWGCLKADGSAYAFGPGLSGSLFNGRSTELGTSGVQIAVGSNEMFLLDSGGNLLAYGLYGTGALGVGRDSSQPWPVRLQSGVVATSVRGTHHLTLLADGTLWGAGDNASGQLGDGTTISRSTPVLCASGVRQFASGSGYSLYVDTAGTLWTVGLRIGLGSTIDSTIPVPVTDHAIACAAGTGFMLVITDDGRLSGIGSNSSGQLGDPTVWGTTWNEPKLVSWDVVACAAGAAHSLFLKKDGTLWARGYNYFGQLGDGTTTSRTAAVQVASGVVAVAAGNYFSLYRTLDGTLWAMGLNANGQFGNGATANQLLPIAIATDVVAFAAGLDHAVYLKTDGTLWAAGANGAGQLGDGTVLARPLRQQLAADVTGFAAGGNASSFIQKPGVGSAPTITAQPQSRTISAGATCVLSAAATGTAPLGYQWYKDGAALADAHGPQLTLVCVSDADAGGYTMVASTTAGSTESLPATLAVGAAPVISPAETVASVGGTTTFLVTAAGSGPLRYQWSKDGVALAEQVGAALALDGIQRSDVGYYRVTVTDDFASTITVDAALNLPTFPIADAAVDQLALGAASDGINFLVAIQGNPNDGTAASAQLVASDGSLVGGRINLGRNGGEAGVGMGGVKAAFDGTNYLLVWADNAVASTTRLYGVFVNKAGALVGSPFAFPVAGGASAYQRPQGLAFDGTRYLVVYSDGTSKPWKLCGRFVTLAGVVDSEMVFASNAVDSFQSVGANSGQFLVAWPARLGDSQYGVQGCLVSDAGVVSPVIPIDSDPSPSYNPLGVAGNGTDFLVVWNHDTGAGYPAPTEWELRSRVVRADASLSVTPLLLCSKATNPVIPVVASDGISFFVAWTQLTLGGTYPNVTSTPEDMSRAGGMDLAGRSVAGDGSPCGPIFNLVVGAGNQALAPLAMAGGKCLVMYNALGAATDGHGANVIRGLLLPATTVTLADWLAQDAVPVEQRGPFDMPCGDGVSNLLKFALGARPLENATARLPAPGLFQQTGQPDALALLFTKNPRAQGIRYALEVSADLVTWDEVDSVTDDLGANPDGTQLVRLREKTPPAAVRRFARLKVEVAP